MTIREIEEVEQKAESQVHVESWRVLRLLADWRRMRKALLHASIFVRCESKEPHAAGTCHPCDVYRLVEAILAETSDEKEPSDDRT